MPSAFIETKKDIEWLKDTHLKGVPLPSKYADFQFAVMQGNKDSPFAVNLYERVTPLLSDDYYRVVFVRTPPVYAECVEYNGKTDEPLGATGTVATDNFADVKRPAPPRPKGSGPIHDPWHLSKLD